MYGWRALHGDVFRRRRNGNRDSFRLARFLGLLRLRRLSHWRRGVCRFHCESSSPCTCGEQSRHAVKLRSPAKRHANTAFPTLPHTATHNTVKPTHFNAACTVVRSDVAVVATCGMSSGSIAFSSSSLIDKVSRGLSSLPDSPSPLEAGMRGRKSCCCLLLDCCVLKPPL
jgi:hypothetical protein